MLTLQVFYKRNRIHAYYSESGSGAALSTVYPGGTFMGFEFDELASMGSGQHAIQAREPADCNKTGEEAYSDTERNAAMHRFEFVLFGYQVGAYTSSEVLGIAAQTIESLHSRPS